MDEQDDTIFFLAKVFKEEAHAQAFMRGQLYMNCLGYFRELETKPDGRADSDEGAEAHFQPSQIKVTVGGYEIKGIVRPVSLFKAASDSLNVYCLFSANSRGLENVDENNSDDLTGHMQLPSQYFEMGTSAVLVCNVTVFLKRVLQAIIATGFDYKLKLVDYFDPQNFHGRHEHPAFSKDINFSWQHEYRIVVDRKQELPNPFLLNIGPIDDICVLTNPQELNRQLQARYSG